MNSFKKYLLGRSSSLSAWIGITLFIAEILLHLGNVSTLMLVLAVVLVAVPEDRVRAFFGDVMQRIEKYL